MSTAATTDRTTTDNGTSKRVVILGGHGKIALLSAPRLNAAGWSVDSLIRNSDHAVDVTAAGANPVVLSLEDASVDQLAETFAGAAAVVFSAGAGGGDPLRTRAVDYDGAVRAIDAAKAAGVSRFIMVSYSRAAVDVNNLDPEDSFYIYAKAKHDADAYLRASGLDYTILGPGRLTSAEASEQLIIADGEGHIPDAAPDAPATSDTSRDNVAAVITHVVTTGASSAATVNFYDGSTPIAEAIPAP